MLIVWNLWRHLKSIEFAGSHDHWAIPISLDLLSVRDCPIPLMSSHALSTFEITEILSALCCFKICIVIFPFCFLCYCNSLIHCHNTFLELLYHNATIFYRFVKNFSLSLTSLKPVQLESKERKASLKKWLAPAMTKLSNQNFVELAPRC